MTDTGLPAIQLRDTAPITRLQSEAWVAKARHLAATRLDLAGSIADPAPVKPAMATDSDEWPFGNFMVAWLDPTGATRRVCHLPDAAFFLKLLGHVYTPIFAARPDLVDVLLDDSRSEMSLTNDVLQIQLRDGLGDRYSMVRNHALMLFFAALWLDEPARGRWLDLYDSAVTLVDSRPGGRPSLEEVARVERDAFADFTTLGAQTMDPDSADELLTTSAVQAIVDYQLYAAAAIGLLWRDYRAQPDATARQRWEREQLSTLYARPDYLNDLWTARL